MFQSIEKTAKNIFFEFFRKGFGINFFFFFFFISQNEKWKIIEYKNLIRKLIRKEIAVLFLKFFPQIHSWYFGFLDFA